MNDRQHGPGLIAGIDHLFAFVSIERHGLLNEDMLLGLRSGESLRAVTILRGRQQNRIDIVALEQCFVRFDIFDIVVRRQLGRPAAAGDGHQLCLFAMPRNALGITASHKSGTDQTKSDVRHGVDSVVKIAHRESDVIELVRATG